MKQTRIITPKKKNKEKNAKRTGVIVEWHLLERHHRLREDGHKEPESENGFGIRKHWGGIEFPMMGVQWIGDGGLVGCWLDSRGRFVRDRRTLRWFGVGGGRVNLAVGKETVAGLLEKALFPMANLSSQCEMVGALDESWLGVFLLCVLVWFAMLVHVLQSLNKIMMLAGNSKLLQSPPSLLFLRSPHKHQGSSLNHFSSQLLSIVCKHPL